MYTPDPFNGGTLEDFQRYVGLELQKLANESQEPEYSHLRVQVLHREPERRREGLIVAADGTNWNPGLGAGIYAYYNASWHKLG